MRGLVVIVCFMLCTIGTQAQDRVSLVNVFLGTAGDHGQLSPGASAPFGLLDVAPQTYPQNHTGYDYRAKQFLGFTHNRFEGVGCKGSGGQLLIKPLGELIRQSEKASPGYYAVSFKNGFRVSIAVKGNTASENFSGQSALLIDFSHALANGFVAEEHHIYGQTISGWIESGTTCRAGTYRTYYTIKFQQPVSYTDSTRHTLTISCPKKLDVKVRFGSSAVPVADWNRELSRIRVKGDLKETRLFYSLLYRCLQAPYQVGPHEYSGWSIWDNYRNELPLLSLIAPDRYQDIVGSIEALYVKGKKDWAGIHEPSNTVRTEHAIVVLLDAFRKGYRVDFKGIKDSLIAENKRLDFKTPDKALESSYDSWALAQVCHILGDDSLYHFYNSKAAAWRNHWDIDFKNVEAPDADQLEARDMYQGTIWQYRWFVPFDQRGLIAACGGEQTYLSQLDRFFAGDYYCASNEPDLQVPYGYQFTSEPWKSQAEIRRYAQDTVVQYYQDLNYRGIGAQVRRVYENQAEGFLQTMDDDAGELSSWYVLAAVGLSPACVGWPVYYLHVPVFSDVVIGRLHIRVVGKGRYISAVKWKGKAYDRNWITHQQLAAGGELTIYAALKPDKNFGVRDQWITDLNRTIN